MSVKIEELLVLNMMQANIVFNPYWLCCLFSAGVRIMCDTPSHLY